MNLKYKKSSSTSEHLNKVKNIARRNECFNCRKKGHKAKQCKPQKKRKPHKKKEEGEEKSDNEETTTVIKELIIFSAEDQSSTSVMRQNSDWFIDSGATHHVTLRRGVFVTYHNGDFRAVKMRNKDISAVISGEGRPYDRID